MLIRIAESLYWMTRHLERADNTARVLDINALYMLEANEGATEEMQWRPLLTIMDADERYAARHPDGRITVQRVIHLLTQDLDNPGAILASLKRARENARVVRDRISNEMWESLNELWLAVDKHLKTSLQPWCAAELYAFVHRQAATFYGLTQSTMMRGQAYGFMALGTLQERADRTARILDVRYHLLLPEPSLVGSTLDDDQWRALLKSLSGYEAYRRDYQSGIRPIDLVELVVLDRAFPRSLAYCVEGMERALERVGTLAGGETPARLAALRRRVEGVRARDILELGLHDYLDELLGLLADLGGALQSDYFEAHLGDTP